MKWFQGSISSAIQAAQSRKVIFLVYINGTDDASKEMSCVWDDESVKAACDEAGFIGLTIEADSENCKQFSKIYPVVCVPCVFFIGENGVPLEVTGKVTPQEFTEKITKARGLHSTQLRGEPLGSPVTPDAVRASRRPPSDLSASPLSVPRMDMSELHSDTSMEESPASPGESIESSNKEVTEEQSPSTSMSEAPPAKQSRLEEASSSSSSPTEGEQASGMSAHKQQQLQKAQDLRERLQREKVAKEVDSQKQEEVERRQAGQNVGKLRQWQAEQESKEMRDQIKKDRDEEKRARQKIRDQIAKDREDRSARFNKEKVDREKVQSNKREASETASKEAASARQQASLDHARLQFRLPDGATVTQQFASDETLGFARLFVKEKVGGQYGAFTLACNYPKRDFTEADMARSLRELDLAPSAALVLLPGSTLSTISPGSDGGGGVIMLLLAPFLAIWTFLYNLLFVTAPQPQGAYNPAPASNQPDNVDEALDRTRQARQARGQGSSGVRVRQQGNMHRLTADGEDDDDDNSTYNGNSTQQL